MDEQSIAPERIDALMTWFLAQDNEWKNGIYALMPYDMADIRFWEEIESRYGDQVK